MIKKKIKSYYKNLRSKVFEHIHGKIIIKKNFFSIVKVSQINDPKIRSFENKKYNYYIVKKARIFTDNNENVAVIKDNFLLPELSFQQVNGRLKSVKYNSVLKKGTTSFIKKFSGTVLNLSQGGSGNNYFHFIFDIVPKIYISHKKIKRKVSFYYVSRPQKWQIKIFRFLGISEKKLIDSTRYKHIFADEIICIDHPWYKKGYIQDEVKKVPSWIIHINRKIFLDKSRKFNSPRKIFLDRSTSKYNHCKIFNQSFLNNWLKKNSFGIYTPEKLSQEKQIYLFKNASIILGAHGAALTNIIFCKPGTKVIEIIPADHPNKKCERISKILKLRYFRIKTKPDNSDKNFPFKIHLNKRHLKIINNNINL
tara:strand:+ start:1886 stop:2983 length:1098 start_codon:yes stop_codon:yes gene_type:complete